MLKIVEVKMDTKFLKKLSMDCFAAKDSRFLRLQEPNPYCDIVTGLKEYPRFLWCLAKNYFHEMNIATKTHFPDVIICVQEEIDIFSVFFAPLFLTAVITPVAVASQKEELYMLTLGQLSEYGRDTIKVLYDKNLIPEELKRLYFNTECRSDCKKETYFQVQLSNENASAEMSDFANLVFKNEYVKNIDISSLSLEQCKTDSLIHSIAKLKENLYIQISKANCKKYVKTLFWI